MENVRIFEEKIVVHINRERAHTVVRNTPSGKEIRKKLEEIGYFKK